MKKEYALQNTCGGFYFYFPKDRNSKAHISDEYMTLFTKEHAEKLVSKKVEGMKEGDTLKLVKVSVATL